MELGSHLAFRAATNLCANSTVIIITLFVVVVVEYSDRLVYCNGCD